MVLLEELAAELAGDVVLLLVVDVLDVNLETLRGMEALPTLLAVNIQRLIQIVHFFSIFPENMHKNMSV